MQKRIIVHYISINLNNNLLLHTETHWLSRDKSVMRVVEIQDEVFFRTKSQSILNFWKIIFGVPNLLILPKFSRYWTRATQNINYYFSHIEGFYKKLMFPEYSVIKGKLFSFFFFFYLIENFENRLAEHEEKSLKKLITEHPNCVTNFSNTVRRFFFSRSVRSRH